MSDAQLDELFAAHCAEGGGPYARIEELRPYLGVREPELPPGIPAERYDENGEPRAWTNEELEELMNATPWPPGTTAADCK